MKRGRPYEIAIIGMGCRFAGASDLSTYFENILERAGLHAGRSARSLGRRDLLRLATRKPTIACPRAGVVTWNRRFRSMRPHTGSCRVRSKGASPNNSWCWTRPPPRSPTPA